ncbi:MAG: hypothetical protein UR53_C0001G0032 [Candidatus Magasanikbacteria bacterium GW2011_GWC2_34_16]|uniref:Uncharacterized protein n=2 Tax=Candidatus Magasanikiibacteriota TaxID=1752731 RepID=A0A0G0HQT1_9BACT|nr:MAG: hypothetical protein UR53_C0001G0032 [Candidatus Magasanikbacteria bacterium GW2011_GWC2_34_16]KKQ40980.1 MAG: hypothetical protein US58_C0008G0009 [Candidatus Magasanikbacteria bacterium GW2011_GWA2_37_8]
MKLKLFFLSLLGVLIAKPALAFCPVCTVAVGAGVGFSRWLGVDDTISGLWIGGLTVSLIGWTINWLDKKKIKFYGRKISIFVLYYGLIVVPFFYTGVIGHPLNTFWGIDKLLLGVIVGSIFFFIGKLVYNNVKKNNGGHAHFPFENIVFPVAPLILLSGLFYFLTR